MVDWAALLFNSLWILACAMALAALSYLSWQASVLGERVSARLRQPAARGVFNFAGLLFCLGLSGAGGWSWQSAVWLLLAAFFGVKWLQSLKVKL